MTRCARPHVFAEAILEDHDRQSRPRPFGLFSRGEVVGNGGCSNHLRWVARARGSAAQRSANARAFDVTVRRPLMNTEELQPAGFHFQLVARDCPGCGTNDSLPFADANIDPEALGAFAFASRKLPEYMHHALVVCRKCDLLYANPAPDQKSLEAAYHDAAFDASDESHYAGLTYASYLPRIAAQLPDRNGALDIGTGDGAFLEQLQLHGFSQVLGVEPSAAPVAAAKPEIRPLIRHAPFRAADFEPESLRLITCFQTIEHVYDPLALCREVLGLLRPGGALFMVSHNRRALLARAMGSKSPI